VRRWLAIVLAIVVAMALLLLIVWYVRRPPALPSLPPLATRLAWPAPFAYLTPEPSRPYKYYFPIVYGSGNVPSARRVRKSLNMVGGISCTELNSLNTDWVYNWAPILGEQCPGIPQLPMIRDRNQLDNLGHKLDDYEGIILTFNEPEYQVCSEGACMSLDELIEAWHDMELLLPGKTFTSPAFAYPYPFEYDFSRFRIWVSR